MITFTTLPRLPQRIDVSALTPKALAGLSASAIEALPMWLGTSSVRVADVFKVSVTADGSDRVVFAGDEPTLEHIGAGMDDGEILVEGPAGCHAGRAMKGGALHIMGPAGDYAGAGMSGGMLTVTGSAGDFVGGGLPGQTSGMSGGAIVIGGNVGERLGDRLRRGVIVAMGDAGDHCASRAVAGTIWVRGRVGTAPAQGMKRASLLLERMPDALPTFLDCGRHELGMLRLLLPSLDRLAGTDIAKRSSGWAHRFLGCVGVDGRGEVLVIS